MTTSLQPVRWTAGDVARGIAALITVLLLLVGIPAALTVVAGTPLPSDLPSLDQVTAALTAPDDGTLFLTALTWVGWIGWATFALALLVEVPAQLRGAPTPRLPTMGLQQRTARVLVASVVVLITAPAVIAPLPAHAIVVTAPPATGIAATEPEEAATPPPTYLVRAGDNLWDIAENWLGDGARFEEIARLNYDTPQPDGAALGPGHQLKPGWVLQLPPHDNPEHADHAGVRPDTDVVTVERGDTLSGIAADHLGDASRYPEIVQATRGIAQPDGRQLSDPDLIYPGWQVYLPTDAVPTPPAAPVPVERSPAAEPVTPQPEPAGRDAPPDHTRHLDERAQDYQPAPPTPTTNVTADVPTATQSVETEAGADDDSDEDGASLLLGTSAGIGALAAAALLALVARKRSRQQRHRRPGLCLPRPEPAAIATELKLRVVQDPLTVEHLDRALRTLAATLSDTGEPLPPMRMARILRDRLELHLATPSTLPAPFAAVAGDDTLWVLDRDADLMDAATTADVLSPYPALASIGWDLDGGHVLLDLEELGTLAVQAGDDDDQSTAILAALTIELATSTWADDLQVTLVGVCPDLPAALGVDRLTHTGDLDRLLTDLDAWAASLRSVLAAAGVDGPRGARSARVVPDAWTPHIVLLGLEATQTQRERLRQLVVGEPRLPVAAVTTAGTPLGQWALTRREDGDLVMLEPPGLTLRPQSLPAAVYEQVLDVLRAADAPATAPGPAWTVGLDTSEPELDELEPSDIEPDVVPAVAAPDSGDAAYAHRDDGSVTPDSEPPPAAPTVRLLGTVEVIGARGVLSAESHRARITETITFLALHPHRDHFLLDEAIWPGDRVPDGRRNQLISRARRWLGTAEDGATFIPLVNPDGYRLAEAVRTDWDLFCDLIRGSLAHASTSDLTAALDLVRGQPFAGTNPRRYGWADIDRQEMISAIVDVAHEVSGRAQRGGDAAIARRAAATGLLAEPGSELLWRDALRAEWLAGNRAGIEELADRLTLLSEELGGDLEPDTLDLLDELLRRRAAHRNTGPALAGSTAHDH